MAKSELPTVIVTPRTIVRRAVMEDLPKIAVWFEYGSGDGFNMVSAAGISSTERYWWERIDESDHCHYSVVLREDGEIIGVHALVCIDWAKALVANMGVRIRADMYRQGYGTETLGAFLTATLDNGIQNIRLDVAATNEAAIWCYTKCGMRMTGEERSEKMRVK